MSYEITWTDHLSESEMADLDALLDRVRDVDGVSAMSEHAYLQMRAGGGGAQHALLRDGMTIVGYAQVTGDQPPQAELLVDPSARGIGLGGRLLESVLAVADPAVTMWAHGNLPAARRLAERAGLGARRRLCRYSRDLDDVLQVQLPPAVSMRSFRADDAEAWLALNAEAFSDLPDQGSWTLADLQCRLEQPWFDPDGFLIATDDEGLAGFHWTKQHARGDGDEPVGEVYVLAVADRARGTGLAAALTAAGLNFLREAGMKSVMLFVDADNPAALRLYSRMGFTEQVCDVLYAAEQDATDRP